MRTLKTFMLLLALSAGIGGVQAAPLAIEERTVGTVLGAVVGGVVGERFGKGRGKTAATIGGAALGALVGAQLLSPKPTAHASRGGGAGAKKSCRRRHARRHAGGGSARARSFYAEETWYRPEGRGRGCRRFCRR